MGVQNICHQFICDKSARGPAALASWSGGVLFACAPLQQRRELRKLHPLPGTSQALAPAAVQQWVCPRCRISNGEDEGTCSQCELPSREGHPVSLARVEPGKVRPAVLRQTVRAWCVRRAQRIVPAPAA